MDSHEKVKYLDIVIYRYIKSVLKQNEVKTETTHPPPPRKHWMKLLSLAAAVFVSSHNGEELCRRRQKWLRGRLG